MGTCLGDEGLACSWRAIQQDSFPRLACSFENLREAKWHDDGLLQCLLSLDQACNIIPCNIRLLPDNHTLKVILHFLFLVLGLIVEYLFSLIVLDVFAHLLDIFFELIQGILEC